MNKRFVSSVFILVSIAITTVFAQGQLGPQADITAVTAGSGLAGGATRGSATLAIDATYTQRRVTGTCAAGSAVGTVNSDGTVSCNAVGLGDSVQTVSTSGTINNQTLNAGVTVLAFTGTSPVLTGLTGGTAGRVVRVYSTTSTISLSNESGLSTTTNRFLNPGSLNWNTAAKAVFTLTYDSTNARWLIDRSQIFPGITIEGNSSIGATATDLTTFSNGPTGINSYSGTTLEWNDEWLNPFSSVTTTSQIGSIYTVQFSGTSSDLSNPAVNSGGRPGIIRLTTGTTSTGSSSIITGDSVVAFVEGKWTYEATVGFPTLSDATNGYIALVGFIDSNVAAQGDGCYFAYDERNNMRTPVNPTNANKLSCYCSSSAADTAFIMNGVAVSSGSFTTVDTTLTALTYPPSGTMFRRLRVVMTGTSLAEFFVDGVKSCQINTNIPSTGTARTGAGVFIRKGGTAGTASRSIDVDQTRLTVVLNSARTP